MRHFLSICSGIEAASVAFQPLGWEAVAFAEIEPFPSAVLAHHYPQVPNLGDMTRFREWDADLLARADMLCGGTPCQAFSVAGLRGSLDDERGNLTLTFCHLYDHLDDLRARAGRAPAVCLWENVPGVLSTADNAFGSFLAGLAGESVPLQPLMRTCYDEANRLANHGSNGLEKLVMSHLYDAANAAKTKLNDKAQ